MKLAEKIEHLEHWINKTSENSIYKPWKTLGHSRKWMKKLQHRTWRRWANRNKDENALQPMYNRYSGWEY